MNPPMTPVTSESRPKCFHSQIIHQVLLWVGYLSPSQGPRTKDSSRTPPKRHMHEEILLKDCWTVRHDDMDTKTKHRKTHLSDTFVFLIYIIQFQRSTFNDFHVQPKPPLDPGLPPRIFCSEKMHLRRRSAGAWELIFPRKICWRNWLQILLYAIWAIWVNPIQPSRVDV